MRPVLATLLQTAQGLVTFVGPDVGIFIDEGSEMGGFAPLPNDVVPGRTVDLDESTIGSRKGDPVAVFRDAGELID